MLNTVIIVHIYFKREHKTHLGILLKPNYKDVAITSCFITVQAVCHAAYHYNIHGGFTKDFNYNDKDGAL